MTINPKESVAKETAITPQEYTYIGYLASLNLYSGTADDIGAKSVTLISIHPRMSPKVTLTTLRQALSGSNPPI